MQLSPWFRFREWLAERYRWAQFPRQQLIPKRPAPPVFTHPMPWAGRGLLILFGSGAVAFGVAVLTILGVLTWGAFRG